MSRLPNFFLVGAVKAGTTSFHRILSAHPQIFMAPIKEPNYFSQPDMRHELYTTNYRRSVSVNLSRYLNGPMRQTIHIADVRTWSDYHRLFKNAQSERAIGEGSNSYLFCPSAPQQIAARFPNAKILIILRNPTERAWSHYLMNRKLGHAIRQDFLEEFHNDTAAQPCGWGITANYFKLGLYAEQLQRFLSVFPSQQIKVIIYNDFQQTPQATIAETFNFLDVDPFFSNDLQTKKNTAALPRYPALNTLIFKSRLASMIKVHLPETLKNSIERALFTRSDLPKLSRVEKQTLNDIYQTDIRRLASMLRRNLDQWLD